MSHQGQFPEIATFLNVTDLEIIKKIRQITSRWGKKLASLWQYGLWSFQAGGTKLERFLPKNQRKLLNFENWVNGDSIISFEYVDS